MMTLRRLLALLCCAGLMADAPTRAADPVKMLGWLTGTWHCTFHMGAQNDAYTAHFSTAMDGKWLRERDTWAAGGDEALFTYVRGSRQWRVVVTESNGGVTVFEAPDTGLAHIAYRSTYPDKSMREYFDRISFREYRVHFVQRAAGKPPVSSSDVCTKI